MTQPTPNPVVPAPVVPAPSALPDTAPLEHASALSPFATPISVVGLLCVVGSFVALFSGHCVWSDLTTFVPTIVGIMGGATAITETARRIALGRVLSK